MLTFTEEQLQYHKQHTNRPFVTVGRRFTQDAITSFDEMSGDECRKWLHDHLVVKSGYTQYEKVIPELRVGRLTREWVKRGFVAGYVGERVLAYEEYGRTCFYSLRSDSYCAFSTGGAVSYEE